MIATFRNTVEGYRGTLLQPINQLEIHKRGIKHDQQQEDKHARLKQVENN